MLERVRITQVRRGHWCKCCLQATSAVWADQAAQGFYPVRLLKPSRMESMQCLGSACLTALVINVFTFSQSL